MSTRSPRASSASFPAGAFLAVVGTLTPRSGMRPGKRLFAAIPMLFAIQQFSEGVIGLTFRYDAPQLNGALTHVYSFLSHVLWPVYIPLAVVSMEPADGRRKAGRNGPGYARGSPA